MSTINSANIQVGQSVTPANNITLSTNVSGDLLISKGNAGALVEINRIKNDGMQDAAKVAYTPSGAGAVATTVQSKLRESVSVKDFGAVGDGVTDDTAAIQAAINASNDKFIYLPSGTYAIGASILFGSNSVGSESSGPAGIYGEGRETIIKALNTSIGTLVKAVNLTGRVFENIVIDAAGNSTCLDTRVTFMTGPSVNHEFRNLRLVNYATTCWLAQQNNDCVIDHIIIDTDPAIGFPVAIDIPASSGAVTMRDVVILRGVVSYGAQIIHFSNCVLSGIKAAYAGDNTTVLFGGYIYPNIINGGNIEIASGISVKSLSFHGTRMENSGNLSACFIGGLGRLETGAQMFGGQLLNTTTNPVKVLEAGVLGVTSYIPRISLNEVFLSADITYQNGTNIYVELINCNANGFIKDSSFSVHGGASNTMLQSAQIVGKTSTYSGLRSFTVAVDAASSEWKSIAVDGQTATYGSALLMVSVNHAEGPGGVFAIIKPGYNNATITTINKQPGVGSWAGVDVNARWLNDSQIEIQFTGGLVPSGTLNAAVFSNGVY